MHFRTHGGKRKGAGRKRTAERPQVPHRARPEPRPNTPVHVTLRLAPAIAKLRRRDRYRAIRQALARTGSDDRCRICHYSVQNNHLHLLCEPAGKGGLTRGMTAFKTSCARRLNAVLGRTGRVFAGRYHARYLCTPTEVRRALLYVLNNWRRHGEHRAHGDWYVDPFSSAAFFDGWKNYTARAWWLPPGEHIPVAAARFWLLTTGWRRHGELHPLAIPGPTA